MDDKRKTQEGLSFIRTIFATRITISQIAIVILSVLLIVQVYQNQILLQRYRISKENPSSFVIGKTIDLPDLPALDGSIYQFDRSSNKMHLVIYFHTYCMYCSGDVPLWNSLQQSAKARNIDIVAVTDEKDVDNIHKFIRDHQIRIPVAVDIEGKLLPQLHVEVTPSKILLTADGQIIQMWRGLTTQQSPSAELGALLSTFGVQPPSLPVHGMGNSQ